MRSKHWIWKSIVAGLCGSAAHLLLMTFKSWAGLLPAFQPYETLQAALGLLVGKEVPAVVPWLLSLVNGAAIVGFLFGRTYRWIPGGNGAVKGAIFGVFGWALMGLVFLPLIGLGAFGTGAGLGSAPALFSLAMLLAYSVVMGLVYAALESLPEHPGRAPKE